jgi:pimeloyl-ACP methyl ester carboxylesterase
VIAREALVSVGRGIELCYQQVGDSPVLLIAGLGQQLHVPTLVIHGDRDRMVHPTGGGATARAIPGARLETIEGLGHDLPTGAWVRLIDQITDHAALKEPA